MNQLTLDDYKKCVEIYNLFKATFAYGLLPSSYKDAIENLFNYSQLLVCTDANIRKFLLCSIDCLELTARSTNALRQEGIKYIGDLITLKKPYGLIGIPGLGKGSVSVIEAQLEVIGLEIGMPLSESEAIALKKIKDTKKCDRCPYYEWEVDVNDQNKLIKTRKCSICSHYDMLYILK